MNDYQHVAIEQTRIAWHYHQFEHDCYGRDCTEDRRLYSAYQRAINSDLAEPGPATPAAARTGRFLMRNHARPIGQR